MRYAFYPRFPSIAFLVAVALGVATFVYRFNQLSGTLGGFENDHFVQLSMARQIVAGDLPFRDYNEIGAPLTTASSAIGQMIGGHALLPDALLSMGAIALGTAVTCWLAARASGSVAIALVVTFILAVLAPRPYAYPKVVLYALGILTAWRYLDRPAAVRVAMLGSVVGISFLFRHDHGVYLGLFAVLTIAAAHGLTAASARRVATVVLVAAAWVVPYLAVMQFNGGVVEYFRKAMVYARRDAERTSFIAPGFEYGSGAPLVRIAPPALPEPVEVSVRWAPATSAEARLERERRYQLANPEPREGTTWSYVLADTSPSNIAALVGDPHVEDTHGVDRTAFTVTRVERRFDGLRAVLARVRLAPELTSRTNALAWLYYLFVSLAPVAALVALFRFRRADWMRIEAASMLPVIVLLGILSVTLLSRGATAIRLPDASAPLAVVGGWLLAVAASQIRQLWPRARVAAVFAAAFTVFIVVVTAGAAVVLGEVPRRFDTSDLDGGVQAALQRTSDVARQLGMSPPLRGLPDLDHPGSLRLAEYVHACTGRRDRVFILGNYPEVYFFAGRPFAGSHVWLVPGFYTSDRDQETIIDRLRRWPVPIVVTEPAPVYESGYRQSFHRVAAFLDTQYRDAGTVTFGDIELRVLVKASTSPSGAYRTSGGARLPCFAAAGSFHVARAQ